MSHPILERLVVFLEGWLLRQQALLDQLLLCSALLHLRRRRRPSEAFDRTGSVPLPAVLPREIPHRRGGRFRHFLSSLERASLWLAGFKPSMILRMAETSAGDLNSDQARELDRLKLETRKSERELSETMARIQESVAAPPILETARKVGRLMDGEISTLDEAMEVLKAAMLRLTESTDGLRGSTVRKVVEVLSPSQTVKVLSLMNGTSSY